MTVKKALLATAIFSALNLAACTAVTGRIMSSNSSKLDDASITAAVKANLAADRARTLTSIDVDTVAGTVYLNGSVKDLETKRRAEALARDVGGVKRVVNNLQSHTFTAGDAPAIN